MILESIWKNKNPDAFYYTEKLKRMEKMVMKTSRSEMKKQKLLTKDQMIDKMRRINAKHNDNLESRKNALKTLMSGIPVGNKVFVLVPVC